jgi:amidase
MYMDGTQMLPLQIVHEGVLTRTVRDTALYFSAAEKFYRNPKLPEIGQIKHAPDRRLRIAFIDNPPLNKVGHQDENTYRTQVETAQLLESLGHHVEQIPLPIDIDVMSEHYLNYYGFLAYMMTSWSQLIVHAKVDKSLLEPFTLGLSKLFKKNAFKTPRSMSLLRKTGRVAEEMFEKYDLMMTPVVSHKTPQIGYFSPHLPYEEISKRAVDYASYTALQNTTGAPAISLPLGIDDNDMPLGVQFAAAYGNDKLLLEIAYELEAAKPWRFIYNM